MANKNIVNFASGLNHQFPQYGIKDTQHIEFWHNSYQPVDPLTNTII